MELAGDVAIIGDEYYPLTGFTVNHETQTETVYTATGKKKDIIQTGSSVDGSFETFKRFRFQNSGTPLQHSIYFFPRKEGTRGRVVVRDVFISGIASNTARGTQEIDFVATKIER